MISPNILKLAGDILDGYAPPGNHHAELAQAVRQLAWELKLETTRANKAEAKLAAAINEVRSIRMTFGGVDVPIIIPALADHLQKKYVHGDE